MKPWRVYDRNGHIDITVQPEGGKTIDIPFLGIYHQKCGSFSGAVMDSAGRKYELKDFYGAGEHAAIL